jgi:putative flavoprotein involved in K+ transport
MSSFVDTIIVGAGPAGLAAGAHLAAAGRDHVVLERGQVGETWRTQRWDAFRLNTPAWMTGLDGDPDRFGTAGDLVASLERRAAVLPVREGVAVREVRRERGGGYRVVTDEGILGCANVVAASGAQCVPRVPAVAGRVAGRRIEHLHVADYRSAAELPAGGALVVGSGQSGAQIAEDLLASGRRVLVATSRVPRAPRRHRGRDVTAWWRDMGVLDEARDAVDPAARGGTQPLIAGGRTISLQGLARQGAELLGRLVAADGPRLRFAGDPVDHARAGDEAAAARRAQIDAWIAARGIDAPAHVADPAEAPLRRDEVRERAALDLRAAGVSAVIWATGFGGDFGWLRMPIHEPGGGPLHHGVATPSPGLYVLGLPWLVRRVSGAVYGIERDAALVAQAIAGRERRVAAERHAVGA